MAKGPLLLLSSIGAEGHFNPVFTIATHLTSKGYDVVFLTIKDFEAKVVSIGAEFLEIAPGITPELLDKMKDLLLHQKTPEDFYQILANIFVNDVPRKTRRLLEVVVELRARDPQRQIIYFEDVFNLSLLPLKLGAPLPEGFGPLPRSIGISPSPLMIESEHTAPPRLDLGPDSTPSGVQRNKALWRLVTRYQMKEMVDAYRRVFSDLGVPGSQEEALEKPWAMGYTAFDATFQLCSPSMEFPLPDLPPTIHFAGILSRKSGAASFAPPAWWDDVLAAKRDGKKIVFVTQGTVRADAHELIVPTIRGLADDDGVLVVAALGARGAELPDDARPAPANARIADYLPYDAILEHADVFVTNGGYGGLTHTVSHGVPVVVAGTSEEKSEVAARSVYSGLGVSCGTQKPTSEMVRAKVGEILGDSRYARRADELRRENEGMDCLGTIEKMVEKLTE